MQADSPVVSTFKDQHRALQELVRELTVVRKHNLKFTDGAPQTDLLMFAEVGLVCMTLEHFVRIVLGESATPEATLFNLLERAVSLRLIELPEGVSVRDICAFRNSLLHGNFAQAATVAQCASVAEYFKSNYASQLERMYRIADFIVAQIDPTTGRRYVAIGE